MNLKVLILEDNSVDAYLLLQELKRTKFDLISKIVEKESDYVKELVDFKPDIILSDFFLTDLTGIKALHIAKELDPELPFIMVTGSIDEETAVQCMKNGADDYITKGHYYRIPTAVASAIERKKDREEKLIALKKLNESEERFRDLFNNMTIGLYRSSSDGKIILVNPTLLKMLGFDNLEELLDRNFKNDVSEPHNTHRYFNDFIGPYGKIQGFESKWVKKDGNILFVRESPRAVYNDNNELAYYEGTVEDVTELKKSESAYAEKDKLYKIIFEQSVNGIFLVDHTTGQILESNIAFLNVVGYNEGEINSLTLYDIFNNSKNTSGKEIDLAEDYSGEKLLKRKDSSLINVRVSVSPLFYKEKQIFCMIVKDITGQKQIEIELEKSRYFLQQILDTLPNILYIYSFDTFEPIYINPRHFPFLGYEYEDFLKLNSIRVLYHPEESYEIERHWNNLKDSSSNEIFELECRLKQVSGDYLWYRLHETVFIRNEDGFPKEILGIATNITDKKVILEEFKKAKEKAEEASRAKSDFLANISHEIRTPLNGIIGITNLLYVSELNPKQKDYVELIKSSSNNLFSLINDILDFSKIESRKTKLNHGVVDINIVVNEAVKLFEIDARKKKIRLYGEIDKKINYNLMTDHTRIKQILFNLLSNALKFTERGSVELSVKEISREADKALLSISVSDTGIGIPVEKVGILFERFTQLDSSYNKKYPGSGLGLTIVKSLVDLFGGKIFVDSKLNSGATFTCEIPFLITEKLIGGVQVSVMPKLFTNGVNNNILLADDDFVNQLYIKTILKEHNLNVTVVSNGSEALKMLSDKTFDLILMDGQMPEMDGFETTKRIREIEIKTGAHIPIVALTAYALNEEKQKCYRCGMDDFVSKPIDEFLLLTTIEKYLNKI